MLPGIRGLNPILEYCACHLQHGLRHLPSNKYLWCTDSCPVNVTGGNGYRIEDLNPAEIDWTGAIRSADQVQIAITTESGTTEQIEVLN